MTQWPLTEKGVLLGVKERQQHILHGNIILLGNLLPKNRILHHISLNLEIKHEFFPHCIDPLIGKESQVGEIDKLNPSFVFENNHLRNAFIVLQAWKQAILSYQKNLTRNWVGPNVCNYTYIFCSLTPDNPKIYIVTRIDLNHGDIAGYLPKELGLLTDFTLFHINTNLQHHAAQV
ncbi:Leucine-rich repeat extensin protein 4 [Spatholobus suberectus]|nr:Leucine-rich repeat extensin protein 4 [Spatholobus suberectus]